MNEGGQEQVPAHTTPTWEMELLVSGATIFGLLQLPQLIDRGYYTAVNLCSPEYGGLLFPLWIYSKVAVITLVVTFLLHLLLRGYWVALVGMNSVYPGGIRWEKLRMGPIALARSQREYGSMAAVIERADNRATRVFGTGFGFAMVMGVLAGVVALVLAASMLLGALIGPGQALWVFAAIVLLLILPWMVASIADRRIGANLSPGGRLARALNAVLGAYARAGLGRRNNTLIALFVSHEGRVRATGTAVLLVLPVVVVLMFQDSMAHGRLPLGLFSSLSAEDAFSPSTSVSAFYGDSKSDGSTVMPMPHIPARVVDGNYLELFIPFVPRLHRPAIARACPQALAPDATLARLDCLAQLSDIRIDDVPLDVHLDASSDASTGQPGMLAMLPLDALPPGRHELSLNSPGRDGGDPSLPQRRFRIPFWK